MRWINALGIVPLFMIMTAVMARLSQQRASHLEDRDARAGGSTGS